MESIKKQRTPEYIKANCDYCFKRFNCYGLVGGDAMCNKCYKDTYICKNCGKFRDLENPKPVKTIHDCICL